MWYKCIFYRLFLKACCLLQFLRQAPFGDKLSERIIANRLLLAANSRMIIYGGMSNYYTKFHKEGTKVAKVFETVLLMPLIREW